MLKSAHVIDSLPAYALGALDAQELAEVRSHLANCVTCRAELEEVRLVVDDLALAIPEVAPPPSLRHRVMALTDHPEHAALLASTPSRWQQALAGFREQRARAVAQFALLALALVLLTSNLFLWDKVSELQTAEPEGRMRAVRLDSTGVFPAADGYLTISGDGVSGGITLDGLPELGDSRQYQLWLVREGVRTSGAVLTVGERGYGGGRVYTPEPLSHYTAAEVTIEPAGGSLQPTSEVILSAELPQR